MLTHMLWCTRISMIAVQALRWIAILPVLLYLWRMYQLRFEGNNGGLAKETFATTGVASPQDAENGINISFSICDHTAGAHRFPAGMFTLDHARIRRGGRSVRW